MGTIQLVFFSLNYGWCLDSPPYASVMDMAGMALALLDEPTMTGSGPKEQPVASGRPA